ncbi:MAG: hypothetical protein L7F78_24835, partial [Syntrophales bacterium LBB04]|nr:hypothetical protein [Syntrophales bacterium LBB04]
EAGARATASHTASLAGSDATWDALCRQFNLIRVKNVEELVDILTTLYFLPDPGGRNLVLIGPGGGASVLLTDEFERRGLRLPVLPDAIRHKLLGFTQLAGNMLRNPIDYSQTMMQSDSLGRAVDILTDWDEIDLCVGFFRPSQFPPSGLEFIFKIGGSLSAAYQASHKPLAYICESAVTPDGQKAVFELVQKFAEARVPVYYSFAAAAEAISTVVKYNERRKSRM